MNFKIGVDGGGTKTKYILTDGSDAIVARRSTPGCSPSIMDHASIRANIADNLRALEAEAQQRDPKAKITDVLFCMAGSRIFWGEFGGQITGYGRVHNFDYSIPVLELATGGKSGLVLHSGTGSFVAAGSADGTAHYAGGLGWRLGDPASAYDLGQHAVARAILELQGWAQSSDLGAAICQATDIHDANALTRHFYTDTKSATMISAFAPHVTRLAEHGNEVAREILINSVTKLGQLANEVIARIFPAKNETQLPVGLSGVILQTAAARNTLGAMLDPRCAMHVITEPPIEGVRQLLARLHA